jgi:alpha-methylacyl-CoA racemase
MTGPLSGVRVLELGAIGPGPHGAMILADLGADVVRVDRPGASSAERVAADVVLRGRSVIQLDFKVAGDRQVLEGLISKSDVLIEGFRPGVAERSGIGPDACLALNPKLIYARMTGWGQSGPRAWQAGHDINYLSLNGVLSQVGRAGDRPIPPLNLVGDYGGGSMFLVVGVLAALLERASSGEGQVIDCAMVDGSAALAQFILSMRNMHMWSDERGTNMLDSGAPFYDTYECSDGRFMAVGAVEPQFFQAVARTLGWQLPDDFNHFDRANWPAMRAEMTARFAQRSRDEWAEAFASVDACVTPVLGFDEACDDPHIAERRVLTKSDNAIEAAPAPRFSRSVLVRRGAAELVSAADIVQRWTAAYTSG